MKNQKGHCLLILLVMILVVIAIVIIGVGMIGRGVKEVNSVRTYNTILKNASLNQTPESVTYTVESPFGTWRLDGAPVWMTKAQPPREMYHLVKEYNDRCFVARVVGLDQPVVISLEHVPMTECE